MSYRRQFLRRIGSTGILIGAGVGSVSGTTASETKTAAVSNDTEDDTDDPQVTRVVVGPDGDWEFEPEEVAISLGETVEWYFESPGHNVTAHPDADDETSVPDDADHFASYEGDDHMAVDEEGTTFSHTFTVPGEYDYVCTPHVPQMVGTVQVEPCIDAEVVVGSEGSAEFDPDDLEIDIGNTVEWNFEESGHNVTSHPEIDGTSVPDDADHFASYEDDDHDETVDEGETYFNTFETAGEYEYVCTQHDDMEGTIGVRDEPAAEVAVGADGETDFDPDELTVEVGDVVRWTFEADGHNVTSHPDADDSASVPKGAEPFASYLADEPADNDLDHDAVRAEGDTFDYRFAAVGDYEYVCTQHEEMTGKVEVVPCGELEDEAEDADVIVGPDRAWAFEPEELEIDVGETVTWHFESPGHNVTSHPDASDRNENPDDAEPFTSYEGENHMAVNEEGTTFSHTFEVPGEYVYVCTPHEQSMIGRIVVTE